MLSVMPLNPSKKYIIGVITILEVLSTSFRKSVKYCHNIMEFKLFIMDLIQVGEPNCTWKSNNVKVRLKVNHKKLKTVGYKISHLILI